MAPTTTTTTEAPARTWRVDLVDFAIQPESLTIAVGDKVRWRNTEGSHTSTSSADVWDSGFIAEGNSYSFTFTEPGVFSYFCEIHPVQMQGTITVEG